MAFSIQWWGAAWADLGVLLSFLYSFAKLAGLARHWGMWPSDLFPNMLEKQSFSITFRLALEYDLKLPLHT